MELLTWFKKIRFVDVLTKCIVTCAILMSALTLNGDWLLILVHILKHRGLLKHFFADEDPLLCTFIKVRLKNYWQFWIGSMLTGYGVYFVIGIFFHWYYYIRQRDRPELWKCQPRKWLPRELELDEIKAGCLSLLVTNTWSAFLACYIYNDGYSTVYYNWREYGVLWWLLQFPLIFIYQDYLTYWAHRIFHMPYLYQRFHRTHHKYAQPTAFSVTAIHPVEISVMQLLLIVPLFTVPIHWPIFQIVALYTYYHGIITHSGINFKAQWWQPWQPDAVFHDNHHQYYHVNFGFNCFLWDKLHNTYRKPDRVYNESIFYGKGKDLHEVTEEELVREIRERETESKTAYSNKCNPYVLKTFTVQKNKWE